MTVHTALGANVHVEVTKPEQPGESWLRLPRMVDLERGRPPGDHWLKLRSLAP